MKKSPRFVVYHALSTMADKSFYFEHHAQAQVAKLNDRETRYGRSRLYTYATVENYERNVVRMVTRVNLLTGQEYQEPSNTPGYMSPASEAYWSA